MDCVWEQAGIRKMRSGLSWYGTGNKQGTGLDWYQSVFELIDMRSFSNLWFWIALAVMWSSASHWVIGVPFDMVTRARRQGDEAMTDLEDVVRVNVNRMLYIVQVSGLWLLGVAFFFLTSLAMLGFVYGVEFAQAVFLLIFPMSFVGVLSLLTANRLNMDQPRGEELCKQLTRHRFYVQGIGMVSVLITSLWGMYQNVSVGILG